MPVYIYITSTIIYLSTGFNSLIHHRTNTKGTISIHHTYGRHLLSRSIKGNASFFECAFNRNKGGGFPLNPQTNSYNYIRWPAIYIVWLFLLVCQLAEDQEGCLLLNLHTQKNDYNNKLTAQWYILM